MRRILMAGAALALLLTAFIASPPPAQAGVGPSQWCTEGWVAGTDGHYQELSNNNTTGYLGVNWGTPDNDWSMNVCYSDRALGSPSFAWGGMVHAGFLKTGPDTYHVYTRCYGEPGIVATANCANDSVTTVTTSASPSGAGASIATLLGVSGSTFSIGTTGAHTGSTTTNNPTTTPTVQYGGTCATVAGITLPAPLTSCGSDAVEAQVATSDLPNLRTGGTTTTCLVLVSGTCHLYAQRAFVEAFDDPNATYFKVLGLGPADPGRICIGFGC